MTGLDSLSNLETVGGAGSGGSSLSTVDTRSRTSVAAASPSRSSLKLPMTNDAPGPETERISSSPSTVLTASSRRCATSVSMSSGADPASVARTRTCGMSTDGKRSTPSPRYAAAPVTTSARMIIVAKMGRRVQISASFCTRLLHDDGLSGGQVPGLGHDGLAPLEAGQDLDALPGA